MRERPILFSAPMVRAILEGRKSQTRRICKPAEAQSLSHVVGIQDPREFGQCPSTIPGSGWFSDEEGDVQFFCPYGAKGDRLWVRETWRSWNETCPDDHDDEPCEPHCNQTYVAYAATPRRGFRPKPDGAAITYLDESSPLEQNPKVLGPWKPSIHMPRWASRITLEVTDVRVERLQAISEADAAAEGAQAKPWGPWWQGYKDIGDGDLVHQDVPGEAPPDWMIEPKRMKDRPWLDRSACDEYRALWESINGAGSWDANPWVWVVSFRRIEA